MGYSTHHIEKITAQLLAAGKEVIEASQASYFDNKKWFRDSVGYELGDNNRLYITLKNGDFVAVELGK